MEDITPISIKVIDLRSIIYVERLEKEWMEHGKIIVGVDFDSTISPYQTLNNQKDMDRCIALLKECKNTGCYIVIHTACREDRYDAIKKYCEEVGIEMDTINVTPIDLPYGKTGSKPYCNHFLDDRAALPSSLDILEMAMYRVRGNRKSKEKLTDVA